MTDETYKIVKEQCARLVPVCRSFSEMSDHNNEYAVEFGVSGHHVNVRLMKSRPFVSGPNSVLLFSRTFNVNDGFIDKEIDFILKNLEDTKKELLKLDDLPTDY